MTLMLRYTTNIISLLLILMQIDKSAEYRTCGQLGPNNTIPLLTNSTTVHRPWHAAIYHKMNGAAPTYKCGGTVISSMTILTAAHCVWGYGENVLVSLGRFRLDASENSAPFYRVDRIIRHPDYNSVNNDNDIALVILASDVIFNDYIQQICLWRKDKTDISAVMDKFGTVVGWGRKATGEVLNELQEASLPVLDITMDLLRYRWSGFVANLFRSVTSGMKFCAGGINGKNICTADSGGAMTFEENGIHYIRGIVSSIPPKRTVNTRLCKSKQYAIVTDVAHYLSWIKDNTIECETKVRCERTLIYMGMYNSCVINFSDEHSARSCKVIFDETLSETDIVLTISGETDIIPEFDDGITKFESVKFLIVEDVKLKTIDRAQFIPFTNIDKLELASNEITQIDADTLDDLKGLRILWLNQNELEMLPADVFRSNKELGTIDLSENKLSTLHADLFKELHKLHTLDLSKNQLRTLPADIFHSNTVMETLRLSRNQLKEIHPDLFKELRLLSTISLRGNELVVVPEGFFRNNRELRHISLEDNKISQIASDFHHFSIYIDLNLKGNVCVDEECGSTTGCDEWKLREMVRIIRVNCTIVRR